MKRLSILIVLFSMLQLPAVCLAFSAVAVVKGEAVKTIYAAWNFATQKQADWAALKGCRAQARDNGLAKRVDICGITLRQKARGGGAIVCGDKGCISVTGYDSKQEAVDGAYQQCKDEYADCQDSDITGWWDEAGYPSRPVKTPAIAKACGPPPGRAVHSTFQCNNGDCTRTFDNGCSVKFQAKYCFDGFSGKWDWKPEGC